jgi:hypothetical protein
MSHSNYWLCWIHCALFSLLSHCRLTTILLSSHYHRTYILLLALTFTAQLFIPTIYPYYLFPLFIPAIDTEVHTRALSKPIC